MRNYQNVDDIRDEGPCILPGHPKEHHLDTKCWQAMRQFLYTRTFADYLRAVNNK